MHCARVLALIVLLVGLVHSFSWDIVVGRNKQLEFLHHGTLTHTELIPSANMITSVTYDAVHYRLLFTDRNSPIVSIYSYDLSTRNIQVLVTRTSHYTPRVVYDPVTQAVYWKDGYSIYSSSLNPASSNKPDGNLFAKLDYYCNDLAVDSCGGYIYWVADEEIGRARLDGSEREVLITGTVYYRLSLAIDQQTQAIYWTEKTHGDHYSIERANFNGKNRTTLYIVRNTQLAFSLAVSKDFIFWHNAEEGIWQLPKNKTLTATKLHSISSSEWLCHRVATNYTIDEQIEGVKSCNALQALIPHESNNGSTVSICQNYCFQGECSVSAEGPTCSCKAGYSGERCEVNACHDYCLHGGVCSLNEENKRVCQCTAGYDGERCDVSICNEYCLQGNCSVGADGLPKCSCKAGYSGERCEVNACHDYCLHGGVCSLNEENKRVCQCTAGYDDERCDVFICNEYCLQGNCSVGADGLPKCSCKAGFSGERCDVNACHKHCLNGGVCSLNKGVEPVCQCTAGYDGERCDRSICNEYCSQGNCSVGVDGLPKCSCKAGFSGERCDVNACHKHCLNGGVCSLNKGVEPVCQCTAGYNGERCEKSICNEYCLQGDCSVGADGLPKCSCKAGFSGERCDVNTCHKHCLNGGVCSLNKGVEPVCQCTAGYNGERCEKSICNEYCLEGNCSVGVDGLPKCSCTPGYSGDRCEVNACHNRCSNNAICYLNEEDEPACECTADYEGERCDIAITQTGDNTTQQVLRDLRSQVSQVIKEELKRILHFSADKLDEYEAKI
ncbi:hypothetical protein PYW07_011505 [Mythimna separata]|uniref:EGF-like domain-containing protein n=1 Tax=Mythimna separata TaxID=271217 RepID=A0AAD7Y9T7_MYTSE|nr:hypothetical protein PYW07_011505 [Mythimna separata]